MKTIRNFLTIALLLAATQIVIGQDFQVPKNYTFEKKEDYAKYEKEIINCIIWLEKTLINKQQDKRKEVNAFLIKWLEGSPYVSIEISQDIVTFLDCSDCLMIFMGGWAKYSLENSDYKNKLKGNIAGVQSVIKFYKNNKEFLGKNKAIEKYIKLQDKGELENTIKERV